MNRDEQTVMIRRPVKRCDSDTPTIDDISAADTLPPRVKFVPASIEIEEPELPNWYLWMLAAAAVVSLWLISWS